MFDELPISITWMSLKPDRAKFLRISQPNPPAPLHEISKNSPRYTTHLIIHDPEGS